MKFVLFLVGTLVLLQNAPKPEQPCLEHFESPRFPPLARQVAIQGKVLAAAIVDRQGNVSSAEAITGHPLFKEVAVANLRTWKFQPNSVADSRNGSFLRIPPRGYRSLSGGRPFHMICRIA